MSTRCHRFMCHTVMPCHPQSEEARLWYSVIDTTTGRKTSRTEYFCPTWDQAQKKLNLLKAKLSPERFAWIEAWATANFRRNTVNCRDLWLDERDDIDEMYENWALPRAQFRKQRTPDAWKHEKEYYNENGENMYPPHLRMNETTFYSTAFGVACMLVGDPDMF